MTPLLGGFCLFVNYILKRFDAFPFSIIASKNKTILTGFFFVFVLMKSKHSLITFIFSSFRKSNVFRRMEEDGFWSREDT